MHWPLVTACPSNDFQHTKLNRFTIDRIIVVAPRDPEGLEFSFTRILHARAERGKRYERRKVTVMTLFFDLQTTHLYFVSYFML